MRAGVNFFFYHHRTFQPTLPPPAIIVDNSFRMYGYNRMVLKLNMIKKDNNVDKTKSKIKIGVKGAKPYDVVCVDGVSV